MARYRNDRGSAQDVNVEGRWVRTAEGAVIVVPDRYVMAPGWTRLDPAPRPRKAGPVPAHPEEG